MKKLFSLLLWLCPLLAAAQTFKLQAPNTVLQGEQFRVSYSIQVDKYKEENLGFKLQGEFTGLDLLMGPSRSARIDTKLINGSTSTTVTITYTYIVQAPKPGTYKLPAARVSIDGKTYTSQSGSVSVHSNKQYTSDSPIGKFLKLAATPPQKKFQGFEAMDKNDLLAVVHVSKAIACPGDQVRATCVVYSQFRLKDVKVETSSISVSGSCPKPTFIHLDAEEPKIASYKGRNYYAYVCLTMNIHPQQAERMSINPVTFKVAAVSEEVTPRQVTKIVNWKSLSKKERKKLIDKIDNEMTPTTQTPEMNVQTTHITSQAVTLHVISLGTYQGAPSSYQIHP